MMSLINHHVSSKTPFAKGTFLLTGIDPHTILLILLPPLLFEASSKVDWHTFKRVSGQSIILAFPGVILAIGLTAAYVFYTFDYGWNWYTALTLGAILSATDPVAVVNAVCSI
jgi:NhaP-type Na+/H+ or K+/H+ antiporter